MKTSNRLHFVMKKQSLLLVFLAGIFCLISVSSAQSQDRIPRDYTNPDEVVSFDRTTSFSRALDVINQFAQEYSGKVIIDRTATESNLGISVPPMHWRDALDLILRAKYLQLIEQRDFFEIVPAQTSSSVQGQSRTVTPAAGDTAITTSSKEVRINAIFFEGNRRALQEIGVDWSTLTENVPSNVGDFVNPQGGGDGQLPVTDGGGNQGAVQDGGFDGPFVQVNSNGAQSVSQSVFNGIVNFGEIFGSGIRVQALFSAFEADNLGEILASPSVRVLEGEEGNIQVGQDFSIKQRDFAGNVTDQFFSVGTILNVVPQVIEYKDTTFIHLEIEAERSSAQPDPVSTIINKQNATTQTLLLNDETTAIAGLYRTEASEVRRGVPILKDLPPWFFGLRYLFGYNSKDYQTRELVILIQASIVPGIPERIEKGVLTGKFEKLRDERLRIQNDLERYRNTAKQQAIVETEEIPTEEEIEDDNMQAPAEEQVSDNNDDTLEVEQVDPEIPVREIELDDPQGENQSGDVSNSISTNDESYTYYVVGGSFKNESNADSYKKQLIEDGHEAEILVNVGDGYYMVAYKGFEDEQEADQFLRQIRKDVNVDAWLYNNY